MELTLDEIQGLTGLSRAQISRLAAAGRLRRTRHGHYDAASVANLRQDFSCPPRRRDRGEEKDVWAVRQRHRFRRELQTILRTRAIRERRAVSAAEIQAAAEAVEDFAEILHTDNRAYARKG